MEYLRVSGIYWCLQAMDIMNNSHAVDTNDIAGYVKQCQQPNGGFAPAEQHDDHLLHTLSAVQVNLCLFIFLNQTVTAVNTATISDCSIQYCK